MLQNETLPIIGWMDILSIFGQTVLALAAVCGVAILILRFILPRFTALSARKSPIKILDTVPLDLKKRLILLEIADKYLLLAASESGVQLISELDGSAVKESLNYSTDIAPPEAAFPRSFREVLQNVWKKPK